MLQTNPQGIADFFRKLKQDDFFVSKQGKWSPAEQLEHLCLSYNNTNKALQHKNGLEESARASYRSYSGISSLYQQALTSAPKHLTEQNPFMPKVLASSSQQELIKHYLSATKALRQTVNDFSEFDLDHKTLNNPFLGRLSIRECIFFLLHHDKHHVINLQASLKEATRA